MAAQNPSDNDMKSMQVKYESMNFAQKSEWIKACRLMNPYEDSHRIIVLSFGSGAEAQEVRNKVLAYLDNIEGTIRKTGKAPAGNLERQIGDFLMGMMA